MEQEILKKIEAQEERLQQIYISVEKTRKYFFWTMIITIITIILPIIALIFVIPWFLGLLTSAYGIN